MRILIADDDRDTVLTLSILLRSEGYDVRLAQDATEALSLAEAFRPDVALLNLDLPGGSGLQVAQELGRRSTRCPFLIAIGAQFGPEDRRLAEISGFHHLMAKPFDRQALLLLLDAMN